MNDIRVGAEEKGTSMAMFQAVVHAREDAKRELRTLQETVRMLAEKRAREREADVRESALETEAGNRPR